MDSENNHTKNKRTGWRKYQAFVIIFLCVGAFTTYWANQPYAESEWVEQETEPCSCNHEITIDTTRKEAPPYFDTPISYPTEEEETLILNAKAKGGNVMGP